MNVFVVYRVCGDYYADYQVITVAASKEAAIKAIKLSIGGWPIPDKSQHDLVHSDMNEANNYTYFGNLDSCNQTCEKRFGGFVVDEMALVE